MIQPPIICFFVVVILYFREDDDDESEGAGCAKLSKFFSKISEPKKRHRYFEDRAMKNVSNF